MCLSLLAQISIYPRALRHSYFSSNTFDISTQCSKSLKDCYVFFWSSLPPKFILRPDMFAPSPASNEIYTFALRGFSLSHLFKIVFEEVDALLFFSAIKIHPTSNMFVSSSGLDKHIYLRAGVPSLKYPFKRELLVIHVLPLFSVTKTNSLTGHVCPF
jgi:hypothetical protein